VIELGADFIDTACVYGPHIARELQLVTATGESRRHYLGRRS